MNVTKMGVASSNNINITSNAMSKPSDNRAETLLRKQNASNIDIMNAIREKTEVDNGMLEEVIPQDVSNISCEATISKKGRDASQYFNYYTSLLTGGDGSIKDYPTSFHRDIGSMETMFEKAAGLYKQIDESSDDEETKVMQREALQKAMLSGTSHHAMNLRAKKMKEDAEEALAEDRAINKSRSKATELGKVSKSLKDITLSFFDDMKQGKFNGGYSEKINEAISKMMSYRDPR